jgi:hypothetical protein
MFTRRARQSGHARLFGSDDVTKCLNCHEIACHAIHETLQIASSCDSSGSILWPVDDIRLYFEVKVLRRM